MKYVKMSLHKAMNLDYIYLNSIRDTKLIHLTPSCYFNIIFSVTLENPKERAAQCWAHFGCSHLGD